MKKVYELSVMIMLLCSVAWASGKPVYYDLVKAAGVKAHIVVIQMKNASIQVRPAFAWGIPGKRQLFKDFITDYKPIAQITGPYFGMANGLPVGDMVIDGRYLFDGFIGSALVIDNKGQAKIIDIPYKWKYSWTGYQMVMQGGIRLIENGKTTLYPRSQGFRHANLFRPAARTAVGIKGDRLIMLAVTKPIYLSKLAAVMKGIGCKEAMTLDGGPSTGLAFGRSIIVNPGRRLPTVLMVVKKTGTIVAAKKIDLKTVYFPVRKVVEQPVQKMKILNGKLSNNLKNPVIPPENEERILANLPLIRYISDEDNPIAPRKFRRDKRKYLYIT